MRAIVQRETGGPEVLRLEEVDDLLPGPGDVVVRLRAAALNRRDLWIRIGQYAGIKLPVIPGADGAGEVLAIGEAVNPVQPGPRVLLYQFSDRRHAPRDQ